MRTHFIVKLLIFSVFINLILSYRVTAQPITTDLEMKCIFIKKFTQFIDWPTNSDVNNVNKPFVISVIGTTPLENELRLKYRNEKIKNKIVIIKHISTINEIDGSNILFIGSNMRRELPEILQYTSDKAILTISDAPEFAEIGVLINYYIYNSNLRFEINKTAVQKSGLKFSYQLYELARIVE